jgi:class 3 adenylate cyclase
MCMGRGCLCRIDARAVGARWAPCKDRRGVHSGKTFVGSIGVEGGNYQFAALGYPGNFCARLVASAEAGEMIVSEAVWQDVSGGNGHSRHAFHGATEPTAMKPAAPNGLC